jgi:hypothetical protein
VNTIYKTIIDNEIIKLVTNRFSVCKNSQIITFIGKALITLAIIKDKINKDLPIIINMSFSFGFFLNINKSKSG